MVDGTVYVGSLDHKVYALEGATGTGGTGVLEARFDVEPTAPTVGQRVTFDASALSDPDGEIQRFEWDLDGTGSSRREANRWDTRLIAPGSTT